MTDLTYAARAGIRWGLLLGSTILAAGCAPPAAQPVPAPLVLETPLPPDAAMAAVRKAAVDSGFVVTADQPGVVTIGPYAIPAHTDVTVTLRATILAAGPGSTVQLSGTARDGMEAALSRRFGGEAPHRPIQPATRGRNAWSWSELERFTAAVRARLSATAP